MITFLAHFLFILAAWTLTIKFAFPLGFALAEGVDLSTHIYWDFWWVIHIWLGWSLLNWQRYTYALAVITSFIEIAIIVTKFALFLDAPNWTLWSSNWFINKVFVLACFVIMLVYFIVERSALATRRRGRRDAEVAEGKFTVTRTQQPDKA